jgi:hypothetical protein
MFHVKRGIAASFSAYATPHPTNPLHSNFPVPTSGSILERTLLTGSLLEQEIRLISSAMRRTVHS